MWASIGRNAEVPNSKRISCLDSSLGWVPACDAGDPLLVVSRVLPKRIEITLVNPLYRILERVWEGSNVVENLVSFSSYGPKYTGFFI